ncbi:MAG: TIR domain-containing protein [Xenococcus sp. MO_188.B8]|nr:TIR domain-containing protein [Xenococcus sp. MO_188.B8]
MTRIFISHSYLDEAIAYKLVNFLLAALSIKEEEIFCSSNPDQGLDFRFTGVPDQLKEKLKNSEALIVLITAHSLHSAWIPFEVGTFWTTEKPVIPILGSGLIHDDLPGPLKSLRSISIEAKYWSDEVNNAINQLAEQLEIKSKLTKRRNDTLREFFEALKDWKSQRAAPDPAQQKEIEALIEKLESKEQLHNQQLEEIKTASQQEKEELERNYQSQKQKFEQSVQSLKSQIRQLKQQLDEARSQNKQLEEKERSLQVKIEQLEQELSEARSQLEQLKERSQTALENKKPEPRQAQKIWVMVLN